MKNVSDRMATPETVLTVDELQRMLGWIVERTRESLGDTMILPFDLYRRPENAEDVFKEEPVDWTFYGSLADEMDFARLGVLAEGVDLADTVADRLGFLLLAVSAALTRKDEGR
ncbi:MAG TPA: hypothetical protein VF680_17940 [Allosphingosinicella sp.]|jgi:hypothetical protein